MLFRSVSPEACPPAEDPGEPLEDRSPAEDPGVSLEDCPPAEDPGEPLEDCPPAEDPGEPLEDRSPAEDPGVSLEDSELPWVIVTDLEVSAFSHMFSFAFFIFLLSLVATQTTVCFYFAFF